MRSTQIERHEKVRADWLLHHKGSGLPLSDQRMSNQLRKQATQKMRFAAGAAETAHHEAQVKPLISRWISGGEDQTDRGGRTFGLILLAAPIALAIGPMLAISTGLYSASTEALLKREKEGAQCIPRAVPWLLAALALMIIAGVATGLLPVKTIQPWPWKVSYEPVNFLVVYFFWQLAFGALLTSWQVRRHGWLGVTIKTQEDATGFLDIKDDQTSEATADHEDRQTNDGSSGSADEMVDLLADIDNTEFEDWMTEDEGNKNNV